MPLDQINYKPVFEICLISKEDVPDQECDVGIRPLSSFSFDPLTVSAMATSIIDYCVNSAPENIQNDFERLTIELLKEMLEIRHEHIGSINLKDYE
jgi:hypothetical protein